MTTQGSEAKDVSGNSDELQCKPQDFKPHNDVHTTVRGRNFKS
jgi:hypothetical protein